MKINELLLHLGDWFFLFFHTAWSLFNLTGWIFRKTRRVHIVTMGLTAASWFLLGIWYGWGYCPCTDWHWMIREAMGRPIDSLSYIHFLIRELTGINAPPDIVDYTVLALFIICCIASLAVNIRDVIIKKGT